MPTSTRALCDGFPALWQEASLVMNVVSVLIFLTLTPLHDYLATIYICPRPCEEGKISGLELDEWVLVS